MNCLFGIELLNYRGFLPSTHHVRIKWMARALRIRDQSRIGVCVLCIYLFGLLLFDV